MKFSTFLSTRMGDQLPIQRLKRDLSYFKNTFNYAAKTEDLYNNLIDNIVFILERKFGRFDIIYNNNEIMYNELLLTISPQIPQFLLIQKKQLLESLDTFGDINNWGDVLKDNIKRDLNLSSTGENKTNYLPIDDNTKDAYSSNDVSSTETHGETTAVSRNTSNYLEFYNNIKWNIADLELEKILKPYFKMFKLYYGPVQESTGGSGGDVADIEQRLENLEKSFEVVVDEVEGNTIQINQNKNDIDQIEQELNTFAKKGLENDFTAVNKFRDNVYVLNDKTLGIGWETNDVKLNLKGGDGNKNGEITAPQGDLILNCKDGNNISMSNKQVTNVPQPQNDNDASNKYYVDEKDRITNLKLTNDYYTKLDCDAKFGSLADIVKVENDLKNNYYTGTKCDETYLTRQKARDVLQTELQRRIIPHFTFTFDNGAANWGRWDVYKYVLEDGINANTIISMFLEYQDAGMSRLIHSINTFINSKFKTEVWVMFKSLNTDTNINKYFDLHIIYTKRFDI